MARQPPKRRRTTFAYAKRRKRFASDKFRPIVYAEANGHNGFTWLENTKKITKALGGLTSVAEITGQAVGKKLTCQHVWNWCKADKFPAAYYLIHQQELHKRGFNAPPKLWRILPAEPE